MPAISLNSAFGSLERIRVAVKHNHEYQIGPKEVDTTHTSEDYTKVSRMHEVRFAPLAHAGRLLITTYSHIDSLGGHTDGDGAS